MFGLLWDLYQQDRINQTSRDVGSVRTDGQAMQRRLDELQRQVDGLSLTCMAMWSLLKSTSGLSDEQLTERVREIDLRDGKLDGRLSPGSQTCGGCGRTMSARHQRCMYCGGAGLRASP